MLTNKVFVRTAKAERKEINLSINHKRMLSLVDGQSTSGELAKRAPPSLRKVWNEFLNELIKDGYVVDTPPAILERKIAPQTMNPLQKQHNVSPVTAQQPHPVAVQTMPDAEAKQKAEKALRASELKAYFATAKKKAQTEAEQAAQDDANARTKLAAATAAAKLSSNVEAKARAEAQHKNEEAARARAQLEIAAATAKANSDAQAIAKAEAIQRDAKAARARTDLEAAMLATKVRTELGAKSHSDAEAKARAEAKQREENAARARAELEAVTAAAKASADAEARAKAETKQRDEKAARARAEFEAAVAATKARSDALAMAKAEAKQKNEEAARARAELNASILAAKPGADSGTKPKAAISREEEAGMPSNEAARMFNLEIENEALKKLLAEAYMEIALLKTACAVKH